MKLEHIALAAILILCTGCSLNVLNGALAYDTGDTRLGYGRATTFDQHGNKTVKTVLDTKGAVNPFTDNAPDEKIVLIYGVMKAAPNMFTREYLMTQDLQQLRNLIGMINKSNQ